MAQFNCDICGVRPASVRVAVLQDGRRRYLDVCDYHYAQLTRHQRTLSPLEALFRAAQADVAGDGSGGGGGEAVEAGDSAIVERYFSDVARELLQRAAERALQQLARAVAEIALDDRAVAGLQRFAATRPGAGGIGLRGAEQRL